MKYYLTTLAITLLSISLYSQNSIENVVLQVERNNTALAALRKNADAELIGNHTGIFLQNPEFAFNYLWGSPEAIGIRKDISLTQSFDFPSAYVYRKEISGHKDQQVELEYQRQRLSVIHRTRLLCNELVYYNALNSELTARVNNASRVADSYRAKFDAGDANILEYNKAQLNLLNLIRDTEATIIEKKRLLSELQLLNGGIAVEFSDSIYPIQPVQDDFDQWYAEAEKSNPVLQWLKQEIEISRKQEKLNSALALPKFMAGYMSEDVVGQYFRGISFGLSIPLMENKNTVKYARARTNALQSTEADNKVQYYNSLKTIHMKVKELQTSINGYREKLSLYSNDELLEKALAHGEISVGEYILELSVYYESHTKLLEMERDLNNTIAELFRYM